MKYIVWIYLVAALLLSIIFCLKLRMINLTGIYQANVHISYNLNDSLNADTAFNSMIIVNYDYDCDYCFLVKWTFDDYLILNKKEIQVPNVLQLKLSPDITHLCSNFSLAKNYKTVKDFKAQIKRNLLHLSFILSKNNLRVQIDGYRKP